MAARGVPPPTVRFTASAFVHFGPCRPVAFLAPIHSLVPVVGHGWCSVELPHGPQCLGGLRYWDVPCPWLVPHSFCQLRPRGGGDGGLGLNSLLRFLRRTICHSPSAVWISFGTREHSPRTSLCPGPVAIRARPAYPGGKHSPALLESFSPGPVLELGMFPGGCTQVPASSPVSAVA